jgi:hypothetical protein
MGFIKFERIAVSFENNNIQKQDEDDGQKRFKKGLLKEVGDDCLLNFIYCGADTDSGTKRDYFFTKNPGVRELPKYKTACVCGHTIVKNFYIQHIPTKKNIVVGSCCIKRYLPEESQGKTCSECGAPHQNKTVDMCNECRPSCDTCDDRYAAQDSCSSCNKLFDSFHCSKHRYMRTCYKCKNQWVKKCIGCEEQTILMPIECKDCKYSYFVCPKHGFRTSCRECYAKSKS